MRKLHQVIHFPLNNKAIIDRFDLNEKADTSKQKNSYIYFGMAKLFSSLILIVVLQSQAWGQTTMAHFGLNGNLNVDIDNVVGTPTAIQAGLSYSGSTSCEGTTCLYCTGSADYIDIFINTTGFSSVSLTWQQKNFISSTGKWDFIGDFNNDGTTDFSSTGHASVVSSCSTVSLSLPASFDNQPNVRLRFTSNVSSGTNFYIDDITITGTFNPTSPFTFTSSNTFTVPAGVTQLTVELWGGGGAGGGITTDYTSYHGGGGSGGQYSKKLVTVTPLQDYPVVVGVGGIGSTGDGTAGGNSTFNGTTVVAVGGAGGTANNGSGGTGSTNGGVGDVVSRGGSGSSGSSGGAGGGGAGTTGNGGDASGVTAGAGTSLNGGDGGAGRTLYGNGYASSNYGGGGGGAMGRSSRTNDYSGADGTQGLVIITWSACTAPTITSFSPTSACSGSGNIITINGKNYVSGGTTVTINGIAATQVTFVSSSQITVPLPAGASGTGNIKVTTCSTATSGLTFTVTPDMIAGAASSTESLCVNSTLTNITHTTTGATGISNSGVSGANGLPKGVSATWAANKITIIGTPTVSGTFNYSIPLTGGCGSANATGTITVISGGGVWRGTTNSDWNTASNWCGGIPTATTDVTIPSAAINQPIIGADGGLCHDINISNGASLTISGSNTLTVSGNWTNNGTFIPNTSTVEYNGSSQTIGSVNYFNLKLSGSGTKTLQTGTKNIGGNFTMTGNATTTSAVVGLTIGGSVYLESNTFFNSGDFTHNVGGNWTNNGWGATFAPGTGTINFTGYDAIINGTNATQNFNNIIVSKTAGQTLSVGGSSTTLTIGGSFTETSGNFAAPATISVGGDLTLTSGTYNAGSNLSVSGNWVNNGGAFNPGSGIVTVSGVTKTIGGTASTIFGNLTIGNNARISLANNQTVNGILTLENGMLNLGAYNLTLGASSSISASSFYTTNMIVADGTGELRKIFTGTGSFMFPIGDNSDGTANYSPMTIDFASGTFAGGAYAGVRVTDSKHPSNTSATNYLTRYWTISQSGITSFSSNITGNYEYGTDITGQEYLQNATEYTGSLPWITYSSLASNTMTASGVTAFGDFTGMEVPPISVSPGSLAGFNYNSGSGPSAQQQFSVSGVTLSANLVITPPADFEISTGSGFQSTPITLTQSGGVVNNTAIYARLKAGLPVGNYSSENVIVSSTGKTSQNVTLSGSVTSLSTETSFWYKADGATPYGSNNWNDETNNNNDATHTGGTITLNDNTVNFNPSLSFSNVFQGMQIASSASVQSFIIVNNPTTGSMVQAGGLIGTTPDLGIRLNSAKNEWRENNNVNDWAYSNLSGAGGRIDGVSGFGFSGWNIVNQNHGSANDSRYYIGGYYTGRSYTGSIAEIMAFTGAVPGPDRVETYLALKYGITLGSTGNAINYINPSGSVVWEGSNTYQNDVAGLGSDGAYGLNQKVSSSINVASGSARVVMATTNDFTASNLSVSRTAVPNGQYLIWGHNNLGVNSLITDGDFDRVARIWKVQNTGVSSAINLQIDLTGFPNPSELSLILDDDANLSNGVSTVVSLSNTSGNLYAASTRFQTGTSYFTIGKCRPPTATLTSNDSDNTFCAGTSVTFTASGGTNYKFRVDELSVQNSTSSTYTTSTLTNGQVVDVIVTNASGCSATSIGETNIVLDLPAVSSATVSPTSVCGSGRVIFSATASSGSIKWYDALTGGNEISVLNPTISSTTTYYAEAISPQGCISAARAGVTALVKTLPEVSSAAVSPTSVCGSDQVTFSATASSGSIKWYDALTGGNEIFILNPTISSTTTYYAEAVSPQGCISAARTGVTANVYTASTIILTSGIQNPTICSGTAISTTVYTFGGSATNASVSGLPNGLAYSVNTTSKTVTISGTPTASGTYTIITSGHTSPCIASSISGTVTVNSVLSVSAILTDITCIGNSSGIITATGNGGQSPYQFKLNSGIYASSNTFSNLAPGNYTVWVKDAFGCEGSTTVEVSQVVSPIDIQTPGANSWIGYVYDGISFNTYAGYLIQPESFSTNFGGDNDVTCIPLFSNGMQDRSILSVTFSVRFLMNSNKTGLYLVDLNSDDGIRLSLDGNIIFSDWTNHAPRLASDVLVPLSGSNLLALEYYENTGQNQVAYNNIREIQNNLTDYIDQTICEGDPLTAIKGTLKLDNGNSLPTGITPSYKWYYQKSPTTQWVEISGANGDAYIPSNSIFEAGTYKVKRVVTIISTNNSGAAGTVTGTIESNEATIIVNAKPIPGSFY